jgi:hypothetical protein
MRFVIALCLLVAVCATDRQVVGTDVSASFQGQSAKMTIWNTKAGAESNINIAFSKLEEMEAGGKSIKAVNLASQDFAWSEPATVSYQGNNATKVEFLSTLDNGAKINVIGYLWRVSGAITFGNITYPTVKDQVKFTVKLSAWPFAKTANTLTFAIELKFKGGKKGEPKNIDVKNSKEKTVVFGPGKFDVADSAIVDGVNMPITATLVTKGSVTSIELVFPSFTKDLAYDPTLSVDNGAMRGLAAPFSALLAIAAALFLSSSRV